MTISCHVPGNPCCHGYSRVTYKGVEMRAHRASWERNHGPIPRGMEVLHRCDNRGCDEITHLFLGTQADNMRDMVSKGRSSKGEDRPLAKLTEEAVREIRASSESGRALAARFNVSKQLISEVRNGKRWTHVTN